MQGGDINALAVPETLVSGPDGTLVVEKRAGKASSILDGCWVYNQIKDRRLCSLSRSMSDQFIALLDTLEIDWNRQYPAHRFVETPVDDNPYYLVLKAYFDNGNDINTVKKRYNLVKNDEGTWESVRVTHTRTPGYWLCDQKKNHKKVYGGLERYRHAFVNI
jgi:hypothetical protein